MKLYRLKHIAAMVAEFTDGGVCQDDPYVAQQCNLATKRVEGMDYLQIDRVCLEVLDKCVVLPRGYESIMSAAIKGKPVPVRSKHFEFNDSGPGVHDCAGCITDAQFIDRAPTPVSKNIPTSTARIMILTDRPEVDDDLTATIYGTDPFGREMWHNNVSGETISVVGSSKANPKSPKYTKNEFQHISALSLPMTRGYKYVYAYHPSTQERWLLGVYHPTEDSPMYRRYVVPTASDGCWVTTNALRSLDIEVSHDEDVMPIQVPMYYYYAMLDQKNEKTPEGLSAARIYWDKANKQVTQWASRNRGVATVVPNVTMAGSPNTWGKKP